MSLSHLSSFVIIVSASRVGKCGIASTEGHCASDLAYLSQFGSTSQINCMGYGGPADPCTLNINNDADSGLNKDPSMCDNGVFFLWDEPQTQGHDSSWAASTWTSYSSKWASQLSAKRQGGMLVTSPMFNDVGFMDQFFAACPACSQQGSDQYIDVLVWNAWIGSWGTPSAEADFIRQQSATMRSKYGNRQVWLGNFGYIGSDATGQKEMDAINTMNSMRSSVDSIYYFAAKDYGGGIPDGVNLLTNNVGGTTIGQQLMAVCAGSTANMTIDTMNVLV